MPQLKCSGWWEQQGYGRQAMSNLLLSFVGGRITGTGVDMVGPFEMNGRLNESDIYLHKQYIGKHEIEYHGVAMGEGAYGGQWSCYGLVGGNWFISISRFTESSSAAALEVQEIE